MRQHKQASHNQTYQQPKEAIAEGFKDKINKKNNSINFQHLASSPFK